MNRTANNFARVLILLLALLGCAALAAACGRTAAPGPGAGGTASAGAPPMSPHIGGQQAAVLDWLAKTNLMWGKGNFTVVDQVTTGEMRTVYQHEVTLASPGPQRALHPLRLTGLSITVPCLSGHDIFVAYAQTDVFTLGQGMQHVAMVFQRAGGTWKLAATVANPAGSWPVLCRQGTAPTAPAVLAPGGYAPELARVLTHAMTGAPATAATAAPFAVNAFLSGAGSVNASAAKQIQQDRRGGVSPDRAPR